MHANDASTHCERIYIAGMGPAVHVPLVIFWTLLLLAVAGTVTLSTASFDLVSASGWFSILFVWQLLANLIMFGFNALVPCFPLDCSSIVVNLLASKGLPPPKIASGVILSSSMVIAAIAGYAIYGIMQMQFGSWTMLAMAGFLAHSTYGVYKDRRDGTLQTSPLFHDRTSKSDRASPTLFERLFIEHSAEEHSGLDLGLLVVAHVILSKASAVLSYR